MKKNINKATACSVVYFPNVTSHPITVHNNHYQKISLKFLSKLKKLSFEDAQQTLKETINELFNYIKQNKNDFLEMIYSVFDRLIEEKKISTIKHIATFYKKAEELSTYLVSSLLMEEFTNPFEYQYSPQEIEFREAKSSFQNMTKYYYDYFL